RAGCRQLRYSGGPSGRVASVPWSLAAGQSRRSGKRTPDPEQDITLHHSVDIEILAMLGEIESPRYGKFPRGWPAEALGCRRGAAVSMRCGSGDSSVVTDTG